MDLPTVTASYRGGSGEPLLLIHGFTDTWRTWTPVIPALERQHEVFAITTMGHHGGPPMPDGSTLTYELVADLIEQEMDDLGLETAHLVGNSAGGWLSLLLAARGRARSVVALCPAGGWEADDLREGKRILRFFERTQSMAPLGKRLAVTIARQPRLRALAFRDVAARPRQITPTGAYYMIVGSANCSIAQQAIALGKSGEGFPDLAPIDAPVRIAYGERDRIIRWPSCYTRMKRMLPAADWVELEGLGHLPQWDDPEVVTHTILEITLRQAAAV